jgi:hypothetical protein
LVGVRLSLANEMIKNIYICILILYIHIYYIFMYEYIIITYKTRKQIKAKRMSEIHTKKGAQGCYTTRSPLVALLRIENQALVPFYREMRA